MEIDYKAIGQRIKIARIKKGITQEAVADLIDITPAHMSNVEEIAMYASIDDVLRKSDEDILLL